MEEIKPNIKKEVREKVLDKELDKDIPIQLEALRDLCNENGLSKQFIELCQYSLNYVEDIILLESRAKAGYSLEEEGTREEVESLDKARTFQHNVLQDQVNIILRNLRKKEADVSWSKVLYDVGGDGVGRAKAGKFALQIAYQSVKKAADIFGMQDQTNEEEETGGHV